MEDHGDAATSDRAWWADAFDPVENLRALADVQAFGRQAAEDLADRILAWGDGRDPGGRQHDGDEAASSELADVAAQMRRDAMLAGEVSARLIEHAVRLVGILVDRLPPRPRSDGSATTVDMPAVGPGEETSAVFWVHNTSAAVVPGVRPHCAPPRSHQGFEMSPRAVQFDPPVLDPVPARSSCGFEIRLRVPPDAPPGSYVSVVMAANVPDLYLPLRVTVQSGGMPE